MFFLYKLLEVNPLLSSKKNFRLTKKKKKNCYCKSEKNFFYLSFPFATVMKYKIAISEPREAIDPLLTDLSSYIAKSKRAIIVTGAGISCSSGIPVSVY